MPQIFARCRLQLADRGLRLAVHHKGRILPVTCLQRIDQIDKRIRRIGRIQPAGSARHDITQLAPRPRTLRRLGRSHETGGLVDPVASHKSGGLLLGEHRENLVRNPLLEVNGDIIQHRLRRRRHGIKFHRRKIQLRNHLRIRLRPRRRFRHPSRRRAGCRIRLLEGRRRNRPDRSKRPDRRHLGHSEQNFPLDRRRHQKPAIRP